MTAVVTIPVYKADLSRAERLSLAQCCRILSSHEIVLVAPDGLNLDVYRTVAGRVLREERFPPEFFSGIAGYNRLMTDAAFYRRFADFDYLLVYQLDAWVFSDELSVWCERGYDYVGAPWFDDFRSHEEGAEPWLCGNGGFSLRRVSKFIAANEDGTARRVMEERGLWEDNVYACGLADTPHAMRLPALEEGLGFAFETSPAYLYERNGRRLPFGCHDWEHFQFVSFWAAFIPYEPDRPRGGKLSIVTKVGEDVEGLLRTADSVLLQTFREFEWIVVDVGASQDVRDCVESTLRPYVAYFGSDCQGGLQHARGEYVMHLNAGEALSGKNGLLRMFEKPWDERVKWRFTQALAENVWSEFDARVLPKGVFRQIAQCLRFSCAHPIHALGAVRSCLAHRQDASQSLYDWFFARCFMTVERLLESGQVVYPSDPAVARDCLRKSVCGLVCRDVLRLTIRKTYAKPAGRLTLFLYSCAHPEGPQTVEVRVNGSLLGCATLQPNAPTLWRFPPEQCKGAGVNGTVEIRLVDGGEFVFGGLAFGRAL